MEHTIRSARVSYAAGALGLALAAGCTSHGTGTGDLAAGPATKARAATFSAR